MNLAMIGLGKMGAAMTERLLSGGHRVFAFDTSPAAVDRVAQAGAQPVASLRAIGTAIETPRIIWIMAPAGQIVDEILAELAHLVAPGDIIIDGGNSNYRDTLRRAGQVPNGVTYLDIGVSGGVWGGKAGYSLMIGGPAETVKRLSPIFETLAPARDKGWARVGPTGAGHFAKMVHNGIEYGAMQAYAEGFALLDAKKEFAFDLAQVAEVWRHGSVVRSWLLDLTAEALTENPPLAGIQPFVADSGEGRWMVAESIAIGVPCPVIAAALIERVRSRVADSFGNKLLAALRNKFGGHEVRKGKKSE
jgi:6-phosphogluconate dehydrogenase